MLALVLPVTMAMDLWPGSRGVAGVIVLAAVATGTGCGAAPPGARVPQLLRPFGGEWTGSVWAEAPLRPRFRWTEVSGAVRYELQVDDTCVAHADCSFPSPEIDESLSEPELQPPAPLPVALTAPVGRRYFWRVRACSDVECWPWSPTLYVNVGRQRQDFNGDGYGDLLTTTRGFFVSGTVDIYFGGALATLVDKPGWTLSSDDVVAVGGESLWPGDLDGDGFPDLAIVAHDRRGIALLRIYAGGEVPGTVPAIEVQDDRSIGDLRRVSDVNGDGFDDLLFTSTSIPTNEILMGGRPLTTGVSRELRLPALDSDGFHDLIGVGDVDHDGEADALGVHPSREATVVSWADEDRPGIVERPIHLGPPLDQLRAQAHLGDPLGSGTAHVLFAGRPTEASALRVRAASLDRADRSATCDADLMAPSGPIAVLASIAAVDDVDGDGRDDFVLGDPESNVAHLFFGGCRFERVLELPGPRPEPGPNGSVRAPKNGARVASPGDMDGDGFPEIAVSSSVYGIDTFMGQVHLYRGGPDLGPAPTLVLPSATGFREGFGLGP